MKKCTIYTLLVAMLVSMASCGNSVGTTLDTTSETSAETESVVETQLSDLLPDADYGGTTFNLLIPAEHDYDFAQEQNGERVNDAAFLRDQKVDELYNVKVNYIPEPGAWADRDSFNNRIKNSVMAQDGAFDVIDGMIAVANLTVSDGLYMNLMDLEGIHFDDPWWAANMDKQLSIGGKLYGICGSALLSMYKSAYILFYNQSLIDLYSLEDPIQHVLNGTWTLDTLLAMTENITTDVNVDGKYTADDLYGYIGDNVTQRGYQTSLELPVISKSDDGSLVFVGLTERFVDAVDMYNTYVHDRKLAWVNGGNNELRYERIKMFTSDQALFAGETIKQIEDFRDMESDFGIIPLPKYDENQENYHTQIGTGSGMYFIPKTARDPKMTVDVLNALNCISMEIVVPEYYEASLKDKFLRKESNRAVLDIIGSSLVMDVTFAYGSTIGNGVNTVFANATTGDVSLASFFASIKQPVEEQLAKLESTFAEME